MCDEGTILALPLGQYSFEILPDRWPFINKSSNERGTCDLCAEVLYMLNTGNDEFRALVHVAPGPIQRVTTASRAQDLLCIRALLRDTSS